MQHRFIQVPILQLEIGHYVGNCVYWLSVLFILSIFYCRKLDHAIKYVQIKSNQAISMPLHQYTHSWVISTVDKVKDSVENTFLWLKTWFNIMHELRKLKYVQYTTS